MHSARGVTRWLVWLNPALTLRENRRKCINRATQAEVRLRRLVNQYVVLPVSARNPQMAIILGTMLYATELTWKNGGG